MDGRGKYRSAPSQREGGSTCGEINKMTRSEGGQKVRNRPDSASEDEKPQKSQPIIGQFGA